MAQKKTARIEPETLMRLAHYSNKPRQFVRWAFPWGSQMLEGFTGPDTWQDDVLKDIEEGMKANSYPLRICVSSGHGIGKSALVAWLTLWGLSTHEHSKLVLTANTADQLKGKTFSEVNKWFQMFKGKDLFTMTATALFSASPDCEKTWRADCQPWNETRPESFAGLHNKKKRVILIMDEGSGIPDSIWEVAEGALTDADTELFWFVFGNPTRNTGRFYECFHKYRHRWLTKKIDARTAKMTSKELARQWEEDYGIDSDFFKVRVLGEFPSSGDNQFIGKDIIEAAAGRQVAESAYYRDPVILGVDCALQGEDEFVIYRRQGLVATQLFAARKLDDEYRAAGIIANHISDQAKKGTPVDAVFIDRGAMGSGIISAGKQMGFDKWIPVIFGAAPLDDLYSNKRAEMWGLLKDWLKSGGCIPNDGHLTAQLMGPEYYLNAKGRIQLEKKEDMKRRGLASPDRADALALTFAMPVESKYINAITNNLKVKKIENQYY